jgi:hypothetical protein
MYGFDSKDESLFPRFKEAGIYGVVSGYNEEAMKKAEEAGLNYYICTGAFGSRDEKEYCISATGNPTPWFSSGCPNHPDIRKRSFEKGEEAAKLPGLKGLIVDGARFSSPASKEGLEAFLTCLCPYCKAEMKRLGFNAERIQASLLAFYKLLKYGEIFSIPRHISALKEWLRFRRLILSEFLKEYTERIKALNPDLERGIYIFTPSLSPLTGQDYEDLSNFFDFLSPMIYRKFDSPYGPACLDHEIGAIGSYGEGKDEYAKEVIRESFLQLTGVDYMSFGTTEELKEKGLPTEIIGKEVKKALSLAGDTKLIPIILLEDRELQKSIGEISLMVEEADFYVYRKDVFRNAVPVLEKFKEPS